MNFLYPAFLAAAALIAVPIIIHLFNFKRYKRIQFSDVRFLKELKEQTNKSRQLKHLLTLLTRIGAILSLVLAFAQPFFGDDSLRHKGKRAISFFIDNSFSMGVQQNGVPVLELAKSKARDIINASSNKDEFQILTQELTGSDTRFLNKEEALAYLAQIQLSAQSRDLASVLQKQQSNLLTSDAKQKQIVVISDMQKNRIALPLKTSVSTRVTFIPMQHISRANVCIDSAWFAEPTITMSAPNTLNVRVRNFDAEKPIQTTLNLNVNSQIKTVRNIELKPSENKIESIPYTAIQSGWQQIQLYLTDYPVSFDDTFFMAGKVDAQKRVLIITDGVSNPFITAAFKTGSSFISDVCNSSAALGKKLENYSLVVCSGLNSISAPLAQALQSYCTNGGGVAIFPSNNINLESYNSALQQLGGAVYGALSKAPLAVSTVNKQHELIRDLFDRIPDNVDLPTTTQHYAMNSATFSTEQKVFGFSNGDAFLSSYKVGAGKVYTVASALESGSTNFASSYWFLPTLFKMAYIGSNNPVYAFTIGADAFLSVKANSAGDNNPFHLSNAQWDAIPQQRNIGNQVQVNLNQSAINSGLYDLKIPNSEADRYVVGLNYNRKESNLECWADNELKNKVALANFDIVAANRNAGDAVASGGTQMNIWKYCLIAALIFLALEILISRLMR